MSDHPVKGIDHLFAIVNDLDDGERVFRKLGFTVSPRGFHSAHMGTANHTIMFANDYFELLGLVAETEHNRQRQEMLADDGQGLRAIACRVSDAAGAETALNALGIQTDGVNEFERPVALPGGGEGRAAFTTLQFHPDVTPRGIMFMCQHRTRETVWVPELMRHANGAKALSALVTTSQSPAADANAYANLFAAGSVSAVNKGAVVRTGGRSASIFVLSPSALAARYKGMDLAALPKTGHSAMVVETHSLDQAAGILGQAGVAAHRTADGLAVAPGDACGLIVEFVEH